jgi:hypothetical protein
MKFKGLALIVLLLIVAGCKPHTPDERPFRTGDVLADVNFDHGYDWENFVNTQAGVQAGIEDGAYRIRMTLPGYTYGLNAQMHDNVSIETQTSQLSADDNNAYGVMCRADPSGNSLGYYFLISGDGYWSIRKGTAGGVKSLVDFDKTDAIHQGRSINTLRVLCIDDYLALYVNDKFVGATYDSTYQRGFAGLTAAVPSKGVIDVTYDYVKIVQASLTDAK